MAKIAFNARFFINNNNANVIEIRLDVGEYQPHVFTSTLTKDDLEHPISSCAHVDQKYMPSAR